MIIPSTFAPTAVLIIAPKFLVSVTPSSNKYVFGELLSNVVDTSSSIDNNLIEMIKIQMADFDKTICTSLPEFCTTPSTVERTTPIWAECYFNDFPRPRNIILKGEKGDQHHVSHETTEDGEKASPSTALMRW